MSRKLQKECSKLQIIKWRTPRGIKPSQIHSGNKYSRKEKHKKEILMSERVFEIYFDDLTESCQRRLEEFYKTSYKDENWDVFPIAEIWLGDDEA